MKRKLGFTWYVQIKIPNIKGEIQHVSYNALLAVNKLQRPIPHFPGWFNHPMMISIHVMLHSWPNINGSSDKQYMIQYIPRNMHTVTALLCFVVVIHWLIFPYPSGLLHWHCGNLPIAPVPAKQPWWIWINTSCEFIMNDCTTTTKQSTTKPCAWDIL